AGDARELGRRFLGPERRAERVEQLERLLERLAGVAAPLRATLHRAEREQRAAALERLRRALVQRERVAERGEGGVVRSVRREQQAAAAAGGRLSPGVVEQLAAARQALDLRLDLQVARGDARLDRVGVDGPHAGVDVAHLLEPVGQVAQQALGR